MTGASSTKAAPLRAIVAALWRGGIRDVVICPGSRSTPMALALREASGVRCWVHLDERAGAFFALGLAKASRRPSAILATSGTAVINFAPAVAEARYGRVPLVLLTADRPPELHGIGAPQTVDQAELYGRHAKWYAALPLPDADDSGVLSVRLVDEAVETAVAAPSGPVQLNLPYREPLLPEGPLRAEAALDGEPTPPTSGRSATAPAASASVMSAAESIAASSRGIIVCGPLDVPGFASSLAELAEASGMPVIADGLSNVRSGSHDRAAVIAHTDLTLRLPGYAERLRPDLVLRFGGTPTAKPLQRLLERTELRQIVVDEGGGWNLAPGSQLVTAEPASAVTSLVDALAGRSPADPGWLEAWRRTDDAAADALRTWLRALDEAFEGAVFVELETALPDDAILIVGNSMPVRDLDAFTPTSAHTARMLGNRGANGIDGVLSTAFGAAAVAERPVVVVVGDLSFLHDLNAFVAARRLGISATIVLIDNDGGGIFSFLPQATAGRPDVGLPQHYEELFGTPHGTDFGPLARALGADHVRPEPAALAATVRDAARRAGVHVVEVRTDRARNVELHHEAFAAVARALGEGP